MRSDIYEYRVETDRGYANRFTLISIHFERLRNYHADWSLYDITVFEALLVLSRTYGNNEFYFQKHRWKSYLRLSWYHIKNSMKKFTDMGILSVERREPKKMNYYQIDYRAINRNLDHIYDFHDVSGEDKRSIKERMKVFYEWWRDYDFNNGSKVEIEHGRARIKFDGIFPIEDEENNE